MEYKILFDAIEQNDVLKVQFLLSRGLHVNYIDCEGYTPLATAIVFGHDTMVQILLQCGADPNIQDYEGYSALIMATYFGNLRIAKLLLQYGANLAIQDNKGDDAIAMGLKRGYLWVSFNLLFGERMCNVFSYAEKIHCMCL